jgi:hypothetical protein
MRRSKMCWINQSLLEMERHKTYLVVRHFCRSVRAWSGNDISTLEEEYQFMIAYPFLSYPQLSSALMHDITVRAIAAPCESSTTSDRICFGHRI